MSHAGSGSAALTDRPGFQRGRKMEVTSLFGEYGLAGAVIAVLLAAVAALWRRLNLQTDARIEDQKQHTAELISVTKDFGKAVDALDRVGRQGGNG